MALVDVKCKTCGTVTPVVIHADEYDELLRGILRMNAFTYLTRAQRDLLLFQSCAGCHIKELTASLPPEDSGSRLGNLARAIRDSVPLVMSEADRKQLATATATRLVRLGVLSVPGEIDAWMDEALGK